MLPPEDFEEYESYLEELLAEYRRFIENIGRNGLAAPMLLHYRDEIEDVFSVLSEQEDIAPFLEKFYQELEKLDEMFLGKAKEYIRELGGPSKLMHYRWTVRPTRDRWWWYIDKEVAVDDVQERRKVNPIIRLWQGFERWLSS